jgi:Tol biopolymer transport system component
VRRNPVDAKFPPYNPHGLALTPGTRLGQYKITTQIGVGGMGEVYRATDTNLKRAVAIKVLPVSVAADAERLARFQREAEVLAALNHANIAHIHGYEELGGVRAIVMELVEGEDLAERLLRGPIPLDEALPMARQIAEALEAAHERGIIHRDLKPANIKVRADGSVKVLDFGLAKAVAGDSGGSTPGTAAMSDSPTLTSPAMMTEIGVILGTAAYMAPEQAKGRPADKRSDLWAFGCVLYEMLTGTRAFEGRDVADTMANVLKLEPDWDRLPTNTPPAVRLLLRRCLRKEKRERLQDAGDARIDIEDALSAPVNGAPPGSEAARARLRPGVLVAGVALLGGAILGGVAVWNLKPSPRSTSAAVAKLTVTLPADEELVVVYPTVAVSPDGTHLIYVARQREVQRLHLRAIDSLESKALLGTEGASAPFFSPNGQWVGFFADGRLKKIPVGGGASQVVCDAPGARGGSWAPDDVIYFAPGALSGLWQVSAAGGAPHPFTTLQQGEISHRWPQVLPGGQAVLFTSRTGPGSDERQVQVQRVSNGERRMLAQGDTGSYVPTGHLVYVQPATGMLVAVTFDVTRLQVGASAPVAVAQGILPGGEGAHYTVSGNGLLAYVAGRSDFDDRTLVWVDRTGKTEPVNAPARSYEIPQVSPDGLQVAFMTSGATFDVWVYNFARGSATKLTSEGSNQFPIWSPDGKRLTYRATRAGTRNIFWRMADGSATEVRLTTGEESHAPGSWSPNGQVLLFTDAKVGRDILALSLRDRKVQPFLQTRSSEAAPRFSPDGRWVAYVSDESGREEIYVRPYPGPGGRWPISTDGGTEPLWNPRGRELFYRKGNKLMAVDIAFQPTPVAGTPRLLFTGDFLPASTPVPNYDVAGDGRRFLMVQPSAREKAASTQITVVVNWFDELRRLVPRK